MSKYIVFLFVSVFSLITSCQPKSKLPEQKARINLVSDPRTLDPRKSRDLSERVLMNMLFEGLTREGKNGKSELALAEEVQVKEEGTRYIFRLKKAFWSNGDRITAKDFIYAWSTSLDPSFLSENSYQLFCIKNAESIKKGKKPISDLGVIALDENTLQIDLERPVPYFLELLSFSIFFPVHEIMDLQGWDLKKNALISSGPFCLKTWKHSDFIDTVKNNKYWDAKTVHLAGVHLVMVTEDTEVRMFEKKELDWAGSPISTFPFDLVDGFLKKDLLHLYPMFGTFFFRLNVEKFPFNNVNIRKAFALAINRKDLVEHVTKGGYSPALCFVPETMGIKADPYFPDGDEAQAQALFQKGLEELKITKEQFPIVVFLYCALQKNHAISQAVQQDWRRVLGVSVELESNERNIYFERIGRQDYQIAASSWSADFNDPVNFLGIFKYKKAFTNNTLWENEEYIDLLDSSELAYGEERNKILQKCESILMEEMPIIPIYHQHMRYIKQDHLKEVAISSLGNLDFKWAYLDNPK